MSHHVRREQRRAKIIAVLGVALALALLVPFATNAELRLRVAQTLGLVASHDRSLLFGADDAVELIVLTEEVPVSETRVGHRFTAVYVAERTPAAVVLHDLSADRAIPLPLVDYDRIAALPDRSAVLFVDERADADGRDHAVLVTVATGEARALPPGETDPGLAGDWRQDVFPRSPGCSAISPTGGQIACLDDRPWVFGDWELSVFPYGRARDERVLLRARGSLPILGWAADESAIYYQNETGVWRVCLPCE